MKRWYLALAGLVFLIPGASSALDRIPPGVDLWATYGNGATYTDFRANPIPAGFFCPESKAFAGRITWGGTSVVKDGRADTLVERIDEARFDKNGVATVRARVRALGLEGTQELTTECGNYRVRAFLAPGEQPLSTMRIEKTRTDGGTFTSILALNIRMVFEPSEKGRATLTLDDGVVFDHATVNPWSLRTGAEAGTFALTADTNGDGRGDTRLTSPGLFAAGVGDGLTYYPPGHCAVFYADPDTPCEHFHQVYTCGYYECLEP